MTMPVHIITGRQNMRRLALKLGVLVTRVVLRLWCLWITLPSISLIRIVLEADSSAKNIARSLSRSLHNHRNDGLDISKMILNRT